MAVSDEKSEITRTLQRGWIRPVLGLLAIVGFVAALIYFRDRVSLDSLAQQESALRAWQDRSPWLVYSAAFVIYVLVAGLSLPMVTILSLVYAWYFGFWHALILISFASTAGATLAFLTSRFLFHDAIQRRLGDRLAAVNSNLQRDGAFYLFSLRLIPLVPFFVLNLVMGLTPIRTRTFWWVSQIGMLPGTMVYVFAGSSVPDLETLARDGVGSIFTARIWVAFAILAAFSVFGEMDHETGETESARRFAVMR